MDNVKDLKKHKTKKRLQQTILDLQAVSKIATEFYIKLEPYKKYRIVYDFLRLILEYRENLLKELVSCKSRLKGKK